MAKFHQELPNDLLKVFEDLETDCENMFGEFMWKRRYAECSSFEDALARLQ